MLARASRAVAAFGGAARAGPGSPAAPSELLGCCAGAWRGTSALVRRRRRALYQAEANPHTNPLKLRKLREKCAQPSLELLRHIAENKISKATTLIDRKNLWYDLRYKKYAPMFLGQVKPRMKFWTAALEEAQMPPPRLPEVAMCGRSNSGKSTLVNYLCGQHSANVKREPGCTTEVVFWQIGTPATLCLVDLPGYGFAMQPEEKRLQWTEFTLWYVRARRNLRRVFVLIDARAGLKPTDREMIAYLERHNVPWQVVVTKCDKVKWKDVAKRVTLMQDELSGSRKMAGQPVPVSALKRKGMDSLREIIDGMKVKKEIVKDGIRRRVYDLLELRRLRRVERDQRRKEAKEAERLKQEAAEAVPAEAQGEGKGRPSSDLHAVLGDWGFDVGEVRPVGPPRPASGTDDGGPKPLVVEAHYTLEDRDSLRVEGFMRNLLATLPSMSSGAPSVQEEQWTGTAVLAGVKAPASTVAAAPPVPAPATALPHEEAQILPYFSTSATVTPWRRASGAGGATGDGDLLSDPTALGGFADAGRDQAEDEEEESSSGSDSELDQATGARTVQRFDPAPRMPAPRAAPKAAQRSAVTGGLGAYAAGTSPFPGLRGPMVPRASDYMGSAGSAGSAGDAGPSSREQVVGLRKDWPRPSKGQDQLYSEDDFASPEDAASGIRLHAPPSPSPETRGVLLAEARKRYEREWAMELEDVEEVRKRAPDIGAVAISPPATLRGAAALLAAAKATTPATAWRGLALKRIDRTGSKGGYIGKEGKKPVPKGKGIWRLLGRPPARIFKKKHMADAAKVLGAHNQKRRRTNLGSGLQWEQAKEKWDAWYKRNKYNWKKVQAAGSPKLEDVEAEYEERKLRRGGRGGGRGRRGGGRERSGRGRG